MGESEDLSQCTHDTEFEVAPCQAGLNFDSFDKRTNDLGNLRAC